MHVVMMASSGLKHSAPGVEGSSIVQLGSICDTCALFNVPELTGIVFVPEISKTAVADGMHRASRFQFAFYHAERSTSNYKY